MNTPRRVLVAVAVLAVVGCGGADRSPASSPSATIPTATRPSGAPIASDDGSRLPTPSPSAASGGGAFDPTRVAVEFDEVVAGLEAPVGVDHAGDGSDRLFVLEQTGRIRIVRDGVLVERPFLDIADRLSAGGERGLLGLAFHPRFPGDPRVFVDYTDEQGNTRVSAFTVDPARPDRVDPATERRLLLVEQPFPNHNGGALAFGPDGFLYIALGDGGGGGDPHGNGQLLQTLLGKILRIDIDRTEGDRAYGIPPSNPYADGADGRRPEIWLTGLRNPWRMSFDRATGDLWIGDVGQNAWEEIDVHRAGSPGGANFGWNVMEGDHCFSPSSGCDPDGLVGPVAEYGHDEGCTAIGGGVYRGTAQAALAGGYVFADYCSGRVWAIDPAGDGARKPTLVGESGRNVTSFGEDEQGELYATDVGSGSLVQVVATRR